MRTSFLSLALLVACAGPAGDDDTDATDDDTRVADTDVRETSLDTRIPGDTDTDAPGDTDLPGDTDTDVPIDTEVVDTEVVDTLPLDTDGLAAACVAAGGAVGAAQCCTSTSDFPNTCAIGACGCAPMYSHTVAVCLCPRRTCWDGTTCR